MSLEKQKHSTELMSSGRGNTGVMAPVVNFGQRWPLAEVQKETRATRRSIAINDFWLSSYAYLITICMN